jgi:hypothetical protein
LVAIRKAWSWKFIVLAAVFAVEIVLLGWAVISSQGGPMFGVMVRPDAAEIIVADQSDVIHSIKVDRVTTPVPGWLIVQADWDDGIPDAIMGSVYVPAGESLDVTIPLDLLQQTPRRVFVTLLADGGRPKVLEYFVPNRPGMEKMRGMGSTLGTSGPTGKAATLDRPIVAGNMVVTANVNLKPMSFQVEAGRASIASASVSTTSAAVTLHGVNAPVGSWAVVSIESTGGLPGTVLGQTKVEQGYHDTVTVNVPSAPVGQKTVASLHVDLGVADFFEYTPLDRGNSPDQPYVAGGRTVVVPVQKLP